MVTRARFIVLEGLDGSGTTTQAAELARAVARAHIPVELTKEPTDGPFGAIIRQVLSGRMFLSPEALALAYAADRRDHLSTASFRLVDPSNGEELASDDAIPLQGRGIIPWLEAGHWVISDRYVVSSLAYQYAQRAERSHLEWLKQINHGVAPPDATIYVNTPSEVCWERLRSRSIHFELFDSPGRLRDVQERYDVAIRHAREMGLLGHFVAVAGDRPADDVTAEIVRFLGSVFPEFSAADAPSSSENS